jgi:large subunit ribosomal protein L23
MDIAQVLITPVITEKAFAAQEKNKYAFKVNKNATKLQVKKAFELFYGIKPESVNVVMTKQKARAAGRGRLIRKRTSDKRAIITLPKGKTIDFAKLAKVKKS